MESKPSEPQVLATGPSASSEFSLSPYKVFLSVLVQVFAEEKPKRTQREVGSFSKLMLTLTQSLDSSFEFIAESISKHDLDSESVALLTKSRDKAQEMKTQGLGSFLELVSNLKSLTWIHRTSLVGLFIRRMFLSFEKLSFTSLTLLFQEFIRFVAHEEDEDHLQVKVANETMSDTLIGEPLRCEPTKRIVKTCPKQLQYFLSKQINLMEINEKKALNPRELFAVISDAYSERKRSPFAAQAGSHVVSSGSSLNEINFLRFVNSMRIKEYPGAKEALINYFDGTATTAQSSNQSKCWAVFNLASLHLHFNHQRLAFEAIKECVSSAQEANDEKCLEFALLLIAKLLIKKKEGDRVVVRGPNKGGHIEEEDILSLLNHLQAKAIKCELNSLAAMAGLHYQQLVGPRQGRPGTVTDADILVVRHSLNQVLLMAYSSRAAHYASLGSSHLTLLTSQLLLHLIVVEPVGGENVYHVNENTCIALRNLALHLWRNLGQFKAATDILEHLASSLFSPYQSHVNSIWEQALAQIKFEYHLFRNNWREASASVAIIRLDDVREADLREAQLLLKQRNKAHAYRIVNRFLVEEERLSSSLSPYFKGRVLLLKSQIMSNSLSLLFECLNLTETHNLLGLQCKCIIELSEHLHRLGQSSQALHVLRRAMIVILANASCYDVGRAYYLFALNSKQVHSLLKGSNGRQLKHSDHLQTALDCNEKAIEKFNLLGERESLREALELQATLYHEKGDFAQRNYWAHQLPTRKGLDQLSLR